MKRAKENIPSLEHEILKVIYVHTSLHMTGPAALEDKAIPIYKRDYSCATLHFGALVDILNTPTKYENKTSLQDLNPCTKDVNITPNGFIKVSNAIDVLVFNHQVIDDGPKDQYQRLIARKITLTEKGAIDYRNNFYLREKRKEELDLRQTNSVIRTNIFTILNVFATVLFSIIVTYIQIKTYNQEKRRDLRELNKSYSDSLKQLQQSRHDSIFEVELLSLHQVNKDSSLKKGETSSKSTGAFK